MINAKLNKLSEVFNTDIKTKTEFKGVSIDSRTIKKCNLFIAIKGNNFDGHNFINAAIKNGAAAVISEKKIAIDVPLIEVNDSSSAMAKLASWWRKKNNIKIIAITGSNGKTTTKEMLYSILKLEYKCIKTIGNLNNNIGVALTLFQIAKKHKYLVLEMGANHRGEIEYLAKTVMPDVGMITNVNDAHIGEFGSLENLIKSKGELYSSLKKDNLAIVDNDSDYKKRWLKLLKTNNITFYGNNTDIYCSDIVETTKGISFNINHKNEKIKINLQLIGKHQSENALAASACALSLGISLKNIKKGLEKVTPTAGRLNVLKIDNLTILDDSYNAGPTSTKKALDTLMSFDNEKIIILGAMSELGDSSKYYHREIGHYAKYLGIEKIYTFGDDAKYYDGVKHFNDISTLYKYIKDSTKDKKYTILVKGSRINHLDKLIAMF